MSLIAYAESRGWTVERFETHGSPTLFKKRPRFLLYMKREDGMYLGSRYSICAFIGSGRVSGSMTELGFGVDRSRKFGNWARLRIILDVWGAPKTKENQPVTK